VGFSLIFFNPDKIESINNLELIFAYKRGLGELKNSPNKKGGENKL
jgi:hypothetical protein